MTHTTITLTHGTTEFEVDVEADVYTSGSDAYGSDEPAMVNVEGVSYSHPTRGTALSARLVDWIEKNYSDYVFDKLCEA